MLQLRVLPILLALPWCLPAQLVISELPVLTPGDTVTRYSDIDPGVVDLGSAGTDQTWSFNLTTDVSVSQAVMANQDSLIDGANLVLQSGPLDMYYHVSDSAWLLLGLSGVDPLGLGFSLVSVYTAPLVEIRTPISYLSHDGQTSELHTGIPLSLIPDSLLNLLPIVPDSLRAVVAFDRNDTVDASGLLTVNNMTWEVLRQVRTQITELRIEAKFSIFPWADVTATVLALAQLEPMPPDTTRSYRFLTAGSAYPVAEVFVDSLGQAERVEVGEMLVASAIRAQQNRIETLRSYPNPTAGTLIVECDCAGSIRQVRGVLSNGQAVDVRWTVVDGARLRLRLPASPGGAISLFLLGLQGEILGMTHVVLGN
ncbi:MAG: hypothetical protein R3301_02850 [Saprospiraceae bacterium]|nr:hypothetical protein [Saprospiraceae bacterium]